MNALWVVGIHAAAALAAARISAYESQPYMDEEFHYRQTQTFMSGKWDVWDPKITTPPGLYVAAVGAARVREIAVGSVPDGVSWFRSLSAATLPVCYLLLRSLVWAKPFTTSNAQRLLGYTGSEEAPSASLAAATAASLPVLFFFAALFYTDVLSAVCVLANLAALGARRPFLAALAAAAGVTVRQTNIIFAAFGYGCAILADEQVVSVRAVASPQVLLGCFRRLFTTHLGFVVLLTACVAFVQWNGSIVLGDKSNHTAVFHPTQMVYLAASVAVFMPLTCLRGLVDLVRAPSATRVASIAVWLVFAFWCLREHCIAHPFILADNRHFTFYLWRRLQLGSDGPVKYAALLPVSLAGAVGSARCVSRIGGLQAAGLAATAALALVPSPLLEFRYYVMPVLLLHLCAAATAVSSTWENALHYAYYAAVNAATVWLFCAKPFTAPDGSRAHFMW